MALYGCAYCSAGLGWEPTQQLRSLSGQTQLCRAMQGPVPEKYPEVRVPFWKSNQIQLFMALFGSFWTFPRLFNHWIPLPSTQRWQLKFLENMIEERFSMIFSGEHNLWRFFNIFDSQREDPSSLQELRWWNSSRAAHAARAAAPSTGASCVGGHAKAGVVGFLVGTGWTDGWSMLVVWFWVNYFPTSLRPH